MVFILILCGPISCWSEENILFVCGWCVACMCVLVNGLCWLTKQPKENRNQVFFRNVSNTCVETKGRKKTKRLRKLQRNTKTITKKKQNQTCGVCVCVPISFSVCVCACVRLFIQIFVSRRNKNKTKRWNGCLLQI